MSQMNWIIFCLCVNFYLLMHGPRYWPHMFFSEVTANQLKVKKNMAAKLTDLSVRLTRNSRGRHRYFAGHNFSYAFL